PPTPAFFREIQSTLLYPTTAAIRAGRLGVAARRRTLNPPHNHPHEHSALSPCSQRPATADWRRPPDRPSSDPLHQPATADWRRPPHLSLFPHRLQRPASADGNLLIPPSSSRKI
uniref:Uncharacterized protein n=1 Tax=Aegilops tauschii subsp. strangulata TaxID=200361 RepID=A0A453GGL3_AEGTS